ncbi:MAG: superoxide dismutase [Thermoanaerobaculia bacterium]|nr:superoxide dismutase [Thermoanaerobaculia bacterium]
MWNRREVLQGSTVALAGLALAGRLAADGPAVAAPATPPSSGPFTLPPLPYAYEALEPAIDAETMRLHHDKHHATYVAKLNETVAAAPELAGKSVEELLRELAGAPEAVRTAVRNHGGGHANHSLFWTSMKPGGATLPAGRLAAAVTAQFGSFDGLREQLTKAAGGVFGSGWAWLALDGGRKLAIATLPNQDSPLSSGQTPLLGIDVWEHAYYLKYQNRRADYIQAFLGVVDWAAIAKRFDEAVGPA